jgi:hypothetical protein
MMTLDSGNILLKPSQRRQVTSSLRRATHLGDRIGDFALSVGMQRTGKQCEVTAKVHDSAGDFICRSRQTDWRNAVRDLARSLSNRLRDQRRELCMSAM